MFVSLNIFSHFLFKMEELQNDRPINLSHFWYPIFFLKNNPKFVFLLQDLSFSFFHFPFSTLLNTHQELRVSDPSWRMPVIIDSSFNNRFNRGFSPSITTITKDQTLLMIRKICTAILI